jgi:hypothetical protein
MKRTRPAAAGVALAALLLGACGDSSDAPPADSPPVGAPQAAADSATAPAVSPAEQVADAQDAGPEAVVALLLAWDTADLRFARGHEDALRALYCMGAVRPCAPDEQSWDHLVVVNGYQYEPLYTAPDSAAYSVVHDPIGVVWLGGMEYTEGGEPVTITLHRLDGQWRITTVEPALRPHLSPTALLRQYAGVDPDSVVLARWLAGR